MGILCCRCSAAQTDSDGQAIECSTPTTPKQLYAAFLRHFSATADVQHAVMGEKVMASFYKRGTYQWEARVRRRGYPDQSRTFESKVEAQMWALQVEAEMQRGSFVVRNEAGQTTMRTLIERFVHEVSPTHKGHVKEAARMLNTAKWKVWETFVGNLKPTDFAEWRDQRMKQVSPATVLREMGDLALIINHAMKEWGVVLPVNPLKLVKRPKVSNGRERRLKPAEAGHELNKSEEQRLLEACTSQSGNTNSCRVHWLRPMVELAIETAMRRGELLRLEWRYVDLGTAVAYLPETKNGEPRHVPLTPKAVGILKSIPRGASVKVFDVSENAFKLAWQRAVKRSGLHDLHFHDLRHEAASRLSEKLSNILELSSVTGHKDLRMLKRYYHPRAEDLAKKLAS